MGAGARLDLISDAMSRRAVQSGNMHAMTDDGQEPADREWLLGAQIPMQEGAPALEALRALTPDELVRLDRASELLGRLAASREYARAVGLMQAVDERHESICDRERPPPATALRPLTETIDAFCVALGEIPDTLVSQARADLGGEDAANLAEDIAAAAGRDAWRVALALPAINEDRRANLVIADRQLRLTDAGRNAVARAAPGVSVVDRPVLDILGDALMIGQEMIGRRVLAYRDLINEQGLAVRLLAAEVQLGHPIAMAVAPAVPAEDDERQTMSLKPLPLDRVAALQAAIRNAEALLADDADAVRADPADVGDAADGGDQGTSDEAGTGETAAEEFIADPGEGVTDEDTAGVGEAAGAEEGFDPDSNAATDAAAAEGPALLPIDDELLIDYARRLPGEAERAWSAALDAVGQEEAHAELAARWSAVLSALAKRAEQQSEELRDAGVDARLSLPGDPAALEVLELEGDARADWLAASIGQMTALQSVVEAYRAVMEPGGAAPRFREPGDERWWESGAFAALRSRAFGLERLTHEVDAAHARLLGRLADEDVGVPVAGSWSYRLRLVDDAQLRGDWEAAVVHLWLALRERAAQLASMPVTSIPEAFESRLAADPELGGYGQGIPLLASVARRILAGMPPPLGLSVALADVLTHPIRALCASLSEVLPNAVAADETGDGPESSTARS